MDSVKVLLDGVIETPLHSSNVVLGSCLCGLVYVLLVKGTYQPKTEKASAGFVKKVVVPLHNLILVLWSLYMHIGLWRAMLSRSDVVSIGCPSHSFVRSEAEDAVLLVLLVSKFYELIDTCIHMALGHQISFLHIFHHSIVLATTSTWYVADISMVLPGATFNTGVHVVMYSYYGLTSLGYKPSWKSAVTTLQVVQFVVSLIAFVMTLVLNSRQECKNMPLFYVASAFNVVLLFLFTQLLVTPKKAIKVKSKTR